LGGEGFGGWSPQLGTPSPQQKYPIAALMSAFFPKSAIHHRGSKFAFWGRADNYLTPARGGFGLDIAPQPDTDDTARVSAGGTSLGQSDSICRGKVVRPSRRQDARGRRTDNDGGLNDRGQPNRRRRSTRIRSDGPRSKWREPSSCNDEQRDIRKSDCGAVYARGLA